MLSLPFFAWKFDALIYTLHTSDQFQLRTGKMTDERCSVSDIFRKQIFDAIKVLRKDKK